MRDVLTTDHIDRALGNSFENRFPSSSWKSRNIWISHIKRREGDLKTDREWERWMITKMEKRVVCVADKRGQQNYCPLWFKVVIWFLDDGYMLYMPVAFYFKAPLSLSLSPNTNIMRILVFSPCTPNQHSVFISKNFKTVVMLGFVLSC